MEKIAGNRLKQHMISNGANFGDSRFSGATNASINASHASSAPSARVATGDKAKGIFGLGKLKPTGATRVTGDSLAAGKTLADRAVAFKAQKASNAATSGSKGILNKAVGMIRKNPLASAGVALGVGVLGHKVMSSKNNNQQMYTNY